MNFFWKSKARARRETQWRLVCELAVGHEARLTALNGLVHRTGEIVLSLLPDTDENRSERARCLALMDQGDGHIETAEARISNLRLFLDLEK